MKRSLLYAVVLISMIVGLLSAVSLSGAEKGNPIETSSGLQYLDLVKGSGREANLG